VLDRQLQLMRAILERCDPRWTGAMSDEMAQLVARLLPERWTIRPLSVEHLALCIQEAPDFAACVGAAGIEPALVAAFGALSYWPEGDAPRSAGNAAGTSAPADVAPDPSPIRVLRGCILERS
jgi:hypothetical protein